MSGEVDLFMEMLKDKGSVIESLIKDLAVFNTEAKGLDHLINRGYVGEADQIKQLKTIQKIMQHQSKALIRITTILLVYAQSSSFTADIGQALIKLGKGQEALQKMFRQR